MKQQLRKLFDWFKSKPEDYFNVNESVSTSHFNWFARYDVSRDDVLANKPKT